MVKNRLKTDVVVLFFMIFMLFGFCGCSVQKFAVNRIAPHIDDVIEKFFEIDNAKLIKAGVAGDALLITGLTELSPENPRLLAQCALLYSAYGLFIELDDPGYATELYAISYKYGLRGLKLNKKFRRGYENGEKINKLVKYLGKKEIDHMFWTGGAMGLGFLLNMDDDARLFDLPDILALFNKVLEIDPDYFFGFAKTISAVVKCLTPQFIDATAGPDNSLPVFTAANDVTGGKLFLVNVFKARFYATAVKDKELYKKLLNDVLSTPVDKYPELTLLNVLAHIKAKDFLDKIDKYFI